MSPTDAQQVAHDRVDALIQMVTEQITLHQFDGSDRVLLKRMVEEGLGDSRGVVRLRFATTLGEIGEPATPVLLEALSRHPDEVVRRAAAKTLTLIGDPAAVPTLLEAFLHDEDTVVRGSAAGALARTGEVSVPALLEILAAAENSETTKGHAAWALAFIGAEAAEYLEPALRSDSLDVQCAVIGAIAKVIQEQPNQQLSQVLLEKLGDECSVIRAEAASALGQVHYPAAIPLLIQALGDRDVEVRKAVVNAIGKTGDETALEPLQRALSDESDVIKVLARVALSQLQRRLEEDWD
jgi:bilin biosynthesis protein